MTLEQAFKTLRWHAQYSTQGNLVSSMMADHEFEEAYRLIFGQAPTYSELQATIEKGITE